MQHTSHGRCTTCVLSMGTCPAALAAGHFSCRGALLCNSFFDSPRLNNVMLREKRGVAGNVYWMWGMPWLHFSKGRAEAHVLRDVRQYSGGSKMLVFWPNEWPLRGQHQILIQNQNSLRQSRLWNIPDPLRHIVSVQSNAKYLCDFQSNLIRFLISKAKPIFQTEGQIPTKQQKQKLKKG